MDQEVALEILKSGRSAFITGAAGAGKTFLLNEFIRWAKKKRLKVARTATTGLAATHLNGNTIHSWSGIGIQRELKRGFFEKMPKTRRQKIERANVLVIDEVSMLHDYMLDMVDEVCRCVREQDVPFGGLQVVLSGDFSQLPPVNRPEDERQGKFAYLSRAWQKLNPAICYLKTQHRQEDQEFVEILNALRNNDIRRRHAARLLERKGAPLKGPYTALYTTNANVDAMNHRRLGDLLKEEHCYEMTGDGADWGVEMLRRSVLAPGLLRLKLGATVMALKNDQVGRFVNGSIGKVVGFGSADQPIVEFNNGRTVQMEVDEWDLRDGTVRVATVRQVPLRLAWAITVHKSQGMTLDGAMLDLRWTFAPGMGYVALSRVKTLESMSLVGLGWSALEMSEEAVKMNRLWLKEAEKVAKEWEEEKAKEKARGEEVKEKAKPVDKERVVESDGDDEEKPKTLPRRKTAKQPSEFSEKVYEVVRQVPKGKVITYGQVAKAMEAPGAARAVGWSLHWNPYGWREGEGVLEGERVPCHRVVNSRGKLANGYGFGGEEGQRERLEEEGVVVGEDGVVDLWKFGVEIPVQD